MIISGSDRRCSAGGRAPSKTRSKLHSARLSGAKYRILFWTEFMIFLLFFWKMGFVIEAKRSENKISELKKTSKIKMIVACRHFKSISISIRLELFCELRKFYQFLKKCFLWVQNAKSVRRRTN